MKTTIHTRLDPSPTNAQQTGLLGVVQECMDLYAASYRKAFRKTNTLPRQCVGNKVLLVQQAQEHLYPWLKTEPQLQQQMVKLLTEHLHKKLLEKGLTPWLNKPARKGGRTFILQNQNPLNKGKPPYGGREILSIGCYQCRRRVQGVNSSTHARACGNKVLPSKKHTV